MTEKTGKITGDKELTEIYCEEVMQHEIVRLVNGATLVVNEEPERSGGKKDSSREIWHLTGDAKENTILVLVEKIFQVDRKITNF